MKDADKAVEKVLAGLRGCEPSAGFEGRVLRAVRKRERADNIRRTIPRYAFLAVAALAAGVIVSLHVPSKTPGHSDAELRADVPALRAPLLPALAEHSYGAERFAAGDRKGMPRGAKVRQVSHEVSYPAPPLPLTEQERLLLQIAHKRTPQVIAPLTPEVQIAQAAREKEEFRIFFDQHTKEDINNGNR